MDAFEADLRLALDALDARQVPAAAPEWEARLLDALRAPSARRPARRLRVRLLVAACITVAALIVFVASGAAARLGVPNPLGGLFGHDEPVMPRHLASPTPPAKPAASARKLVVAAVTGTASNAISAVSSSGAERLLVAGGGGPIRDLAWSPDGARLAYLQAASATDATSALWCYDPARAKTTRLTLRAAPRASIEGFAWYGAHRLVVAALSGAKPGTNGALWVCDVATGSQRPLRDAAGHVLRGVSPSWSAAGRLLTLVEYGAASHSSATQGGAAQTKTAERLLAFDTRHGGVSVLAGGFVFAHSDGDAFAYPLVSPDGALVYTAQTGGDPGFACTVYRRAGGKALVAKGLLWPAPGSWSVDGRLAFSGSAELKQWRHDTIRVWRPGAAKATAILAPTAQPIGSLAWSPKGTQIAYSVTRASGANGSLWVVHANGANNHLLLAHGSWPAWAVAPVDFTSSAVATAAGASSASPPKPSPSATGARPAPTPQAASSARSSSPTSLPTSWTGGATATPKWQQRPSGTKADLTSVAFSGSGDGWAVGAGGAVVATSDGGVTWQAESSGSGYSMSDVAFAGGRHGWAVGATVLGTADGGRSWTTQAAAGPGELSAVTAVDATHAWAAGGTAGAQGRVLVTTDGLSWRAQDVGVCQRLRDIAFSDRLHGWAVGFWGTIIATTDGGATWTAQHATPDGVSGGADLSAATLDSVDFLNDDVGWAAGYVSGGLSCRALLLATTDGGAHWTTRSLGAIGTGLHDVTFVDAQHGWAAAWYRQQAVILATADGGTTWRAKCRGSNDVIGLAAAGAGCICAVGDHGTIVTLAGG